MKILLVEDHKDIAGVIYDYFELKGHSVDHASDGNHGLALCLESIYDVIVLDITLPKLSGIDVCTKLRQQGVDTPVLMLTARSEKEDILEGFSKGADDYLVKPFDFNILEARVQALFRRKEGNSSTKQLNFESLALDLTNRTAFREGHEIVLNKSQFVILKTLMLRAPEPVTRKEIIELVWPDDLPDNDVLRSHIYQLRAKIDKPFDHHYLHTVPKLGYQLISSNT